ncbi:MAG: metallophosphoesterase [Vulcanimicrobiota bacterium]
MLELCWNRPLLRCCERIALGLERPTRVAYLSDLHCAAWSGPMLTGLALELERSRPDLILLGGDLLDFPCGHSPLRHWVQRMARMCPLAGVPGNHDRWVGLRRVKSSLTQSIHWLDESPLELNCGLRLCGQPSQQATNRSILVGHEPTGVKAAARAGFPVMLAGHLHGCQWIWFQRGGLDYPGAWFFAYHGPRFRVGPTQLLVSRGVSDTLPIRLACPRDYLWLELT